MEYLQAKPLELPSTVMESSAGEGEGTLSSNISNGEMFLVDARGKSFRLSWKTEAKQSPAARALPAGKYRLRTYRIQRELKGETWHLSSTAPAIRTVEIVAGENTVLKVDRRITVTSRVKGKRGMMNIVGEHGAGLSIYQAGRRIPIRYRVLDAEGEELAQGAMTYG